MTDESTIDLNIRNLCGSNRRLRRSRSVWHTAIRSLRQRLQDLVLSEKTQGHDRDEISAAIYRNGRKTNGIPEPCGSEFIRKGVGYIRCKFVVHTTGFANKFAPTGAVFAVRQHYDSRGRGVSGAPRFAAFGSSCKTSFYPKKRRAMTGTKSRPRSTGTDAKPTESPNPEGVNSFAKGAGTFDANWSSVPPPSRINSLPQGLCLLCDSTTTVAKTECLAHRDSQPSAAPARTAPAIRTYRQFPPAPSVAHPDRRRCSTRLRHIPC